MSNFDNNWRRKQELVARPYIDDIYREVFGDDIEINRFEREGELILDIKFSIDVQIVLSTGMILLGQEKALSYEYAKYNSVTVEYMQNPVTNEHGDWFHLAVQFYFVGYLNQVQTAFDRWIIINWPSTVLATKSGVLRWLGNQNQRGGAQASFKYVNMNDIPDSCIIGKSHQGGPLSNGLST